MAPLESGRANLEPGGAGGDGLAERPRRAARLVLRTVANPEIGIPDRLVRRLEELLARPGRALRRRSIARANATEQPAEDRQNERSDGGHAARKGKQQCANRCHLRQSSRTTKEALLKSGLDLAHPLCQRDDGPRCANDTRSMIAVSWSVQAMNSQERVEELQAKGATYLPRHPRLNERGVSPRRCLDEDHREAHEREEKGVVDRRGVARQP